MLCWSCWASCDLSTAPLDARFCHCWFRSKFFPMPWPGTRPCSRARPFSARRWAGFCTRCFGGPAGVYGVSVVACGVATVALARLRARTTVRAKEEFTVTHGARRFALHLDPQTHPGSDIAGSVCRSSRGRGGVAAGLCARNSAHRTVGSGIIARLTRSRAPRSWQYCSPIVR